MWFALLTLVPVADWIPARWTHAEPASLQIVANTPVNCLLLEAPQWSKPLVDGAREKEIATVGIVHEADAAAVEQVAALGMQGLALEGNFEAAAIQRLRDSAKAHHLEFIVITDRGRMDFGSPDAVLASHQGVWPGIAVEEDGKAKAAPSGAPWINTNSGFLRFVREDTRAVLWMANRPPAHTIVTPERYTQVIGDAALVNAKWVISLDEEFDRDLMKGTPDAKRAWSNMMASLTHFYVKPLWAGARTAGKLGIIEDIDSGALLSGGVLDMIAVKHTPVRPIPSRLLSAKATEGLDIAVNVDPASLTASQNGDLRAFSRRGGTLLNGPPGWRFPPAKEGSITLPEEATKQLDEIWKEVNGLIYRRNLGVRLFNVSSMLSSLNELPDGRLVVHLVNYADFPVESVTVSVPGETKLATIYAPGKAPRQAELFESEDGTGIDVPLVESAVTIVIEQPVIKPGRRPVE